MEPKINSMGRSGPRVTVNRGARARRRMRRYFAITAAMVAAVAFPFPAANCLECGRRLNADYDPEGDTERGGAGVRPRRSSQGARPFEPRPD